MAIKRQIKSYEKGPHIKQFTFATTNPTVSDDVNKQFDVGSMWFNTVQKIWLTCTSIAAGAAAWGLSGTPTFTTAQRDALVTPPTGMSIFNTTTNAQETYNGTTWTSGDGGSTSTYIEEVVVLTAAAAVNLVATLPAGATPSSSLMNWDTTHGGYTGTGSPVKTGFGTAADPDGYCLSGTALTKNTKTTGKGALCGAQVAAATTLQLAALTTAGAVGDAGDKFVSGSVRVRLYYDLPTPIPNAP